MAKLEFIPGTSVMPGIDPLIRFLAKLTRGVPSELRYGNKAQAEAKRTFLASRLEQEYYSASVVQVQSRFLIAVYPVEYDFDGRAGRLIRRVAEVANSPTKRAPFATVSGPRNNPRNRHTSSKPHVFTSFTGSRVAVDYTNPRPASILSRREQLDIVSKRLNAQPSRESRARVSGE